MCSLGYLSSSQAAASVCSTLRKSGEREQVVKPNWVDFPTSVNQKGRASANSCASDHLLPQYHNEWGPQSPRNFLWLWR